MERNYIKAAAEELLGTGSEARLLNTKDNPLRGGRKTRSQIVHPVLKDSDALLAVDPKTLEAMLGHRNRESEVTIYESSIGFLPEEEK